MPELDDTPVLFFDRDVGIAVPKALNLLKLPSKVEYHYRHFNEGALDDVWMPAVGERGWLLVGHDSQHHLVSSELEAIKQHQMGCFYLWGANAKRWQKLLCFLKAYDRILDAAKTTPKPFIFRVSVSGQLRPVAIPTSQD